MPSSNTSPLLADTPPNYLITALSLRPDPNAVKKYAVVTIEPKELSKQAIWHLRQVLEVYISPMNVDIADTYRRKLRGALERNQALQISWAGGNLDDIGSHHYSYIQIGDLLLELLQSDRFSTQHSSAPSGNHVHGMLRDLSFDWSQPNPAQRHILRHHQH